MASYTLNFDTGTSTKLVDPGPGKPPIRLNDDKVDRQGRFVAGYMDYEKREPLCSVSGGLFAVYGLGVPAFRSRASGVDVELGESDLELTSMTKGLRNRDEGNFWSDRWCFACQYGANRKTWTSAGQSAWSYCEWSWALGWPIVTTPGANAP